MVYHRESQTEVRLFYTTFNVYGFLLPFLIILIFYSGGLPSYPCLVLVWGRMLDGWVQCCR